MHLEDGKKITRFGYDIILEDISLIFIVNQMSLH